MQRVRCLSWLSSWVSPPMESTRCRTMARPISGAPHCAGASQIHPVEPLKNRSKSTAGIPMPASSMTTHTRPRWLLTRTLISLPGFVYRTALVSRLGQDLLNGSLLDDLITKFAFGEEAGQHDAADGRPNSSERAVSMMTGRSRKLGLARIFWHTSVPD